jgi:Uncharacterized protein conserved in bacteria (DUF2237)
MRSSSASFLLFLLATSLSFVAASVTAESYQNVYGQTLQSCSSDGMALTGYTRTGYCVDEYDDQGSHHICIDLSSSTSGSSSNGGGGSDDNFCTVTGQSDWCSSQEMPCHDDNSYNYCAIQNWCVCQWAFASYLQAAGGCDSIQTIVCESINLQAILAYQQQATTQEKYANALQCIVDRCGLDMNNLASGSSASKKSVWSQASGAGGQSSSSSSSTRTALLFLVGIAIMVGTVWVLRRMGSKRQRKDSDAAAGDHLLPTGTPNKNLVAMS